MVAMVVIDQLLLAGKQVLYFESDTSNADVWMCLQRDLDNPFDYDVRFVDDVLRRKEPAR